jgi:hypothetical protein
MRCTYLFPSGDPSLSRSSGDRNERHGDRPDRLYCMPGAPRGAPLVPSRRGLKRPDRLLYMTGRHVAFASRPAIVSRGEPKVTLAAPPSALAPRPSSRGAGVSKSALFDGAVVTEIDGNRRAAGGYGSEWRLGRFRFLVPVICRESGNGNRNPRARERAGEPGGMGGEVRAAQRAVER